MLTAVTTDSPVLNSLVSQNFGRCTFFILFDENKNSTEINRNPFANTLGIGAGIQLAQLLVKKNVDLIITNQMGNGPFRLLISASIKVFHGMGLTAVQAVELLAKNDLPLMTIPSMLTGSKDRKRYGTN